MTILGIVIVIFGAYLTIAYLAQSGEAKFAGVQLNLPFGVIVMIVGVVVIVFPYTPLYEGTNNGQTAAGVSPNASAASSSSTSANPPTTISREQEEQRKKRLLSVVTDQGIRATCSKTNDDHFTGAWMVMECPSSEVAGLRLGLFPNSKAMYTVYNKAAEEAAVKRNSGWANCESKPGEGLWTINEGDPPGGRVFCNLNDQGQVWFEWTYDVPKVLVYAYRKDDNFKALHDWWLAF
jgi:hypothetical protein